MTLGRSEVKNIEQTCLNQRCCYLQLSVVMLSDLHTESGEGYRPLSPEELFGFFDRMFLTFVLLKRETLSKDFLKHLSE